MAPTVSVLAYDGMSAFETGIVTEVFGLVWPDVDLDIDAEWYELTVCTERPEPVRMIGGATLRSPHGLDALVAADTVIVPSVSDVDVPPSPELVAALRLAHRRGARMVSICSGAFALAAAGLLDGRRATTHWRYADLLRRRFPAVRVDPAPLYVDDGDVLTSAGCAAGLDLSLHIVRRDFGAAVVNAVARRLVVQPHREGGQAQYIEAPVTADPDDDRVGRSMAWAREHLAEPITVEALARVAHMSARTYLRHFTRCAGTSPIRWLIDQRVRASLPLLETSEMPVERIASAVGFDAPVTFRHHFQAAMRTSPSAYRRTFRGTP
ncbi:MAG TPA: helix-turn-helix domain-containing protein [Actinophytocola sp.]|nr:helix-turn-helix domain-containing protein [Actinophytocola sp.]